MVDPKGRELAVPENWGRGECWECLNRGAMSAIGCSGNPSRIGLVRNV